MVEEGALDRWFALEMGGLAKSVVAASRPIGDLLGDERPVARTRSGEEHVYDRAAVEAMAATLSPLERRRVKVPITFWVDRDMDNEVYVQDEPSAHALRAVAAVPRAREMRGGKLWLAYSLAREVSNKYPTLFQFVYF